MTTWNNLPRPFTEGQPRLRNDRWGFTFADGAGTTHLCHDYPDRDAVSASRTCRLFCATIGGNGAIGLARVPRALTAG